MSAELVISVYDMMPAMCQFHRYNLNASSLSAICPSREARMNVDRRLNDHSLF
jgi:hypothetical protein